MFPDKKHPSLRFMQLSVVVLSLTATQSLLGTFPLTRVEPVFAQSSSPSPSFPLPESLPNGTTVKVDGSSSMRVINEALRKRFEQKYPSTKVDLATGGSDQASSALQRGDINLAAIGRPLTPQEKAQGLVFVPVSREKIAIIVGKDNPFDKNLTFEQFAKMFRGEITNWSTVGGPPGKIRFIDHPLDGDTRRSLSTYDIFKKAPFKNGANTTRLPQDDTASIVSALGKDGISYAIADQVVDLPNVRVLPMHKTLPSDPRYPYSQPRGYVYQTQKVTPGLLAFLGFVTSEPGHEIVAAAKQQETEAVRQSTVIAPSASPAAQPPLIASTTTSENNGFPWWWLLLLIAIPYLLFLWLFLMRRRDIRAQATENTDHLKMARQNQEIVGLVLPQIQTDLDQRIDSIVDPKIARQTEQISNLVSQQMQTELDQRIDSIVNLKMAHQTQGITSLVLQQMQTGLDQRINIDSIKAAILSDFKKQQFYLEMHSVKAELENFYTRLEEFETQLYSRINQRDTEFYNWTHSQLLALHGCLTDRQALLEQFDTLSIRLKAELDNVRCVDPNSFTPWKGMSVQPQLSSVQSPQLPER